MTSNGGDYGNQSEGTIFGSILYASANGQSGQVGDEFGRGLALSFDSHILAVGAPGHNNETGYVNIYRSSLNGSTYQWNTPVTITGPHTTSRFGQSVTMTWDGDRIAVGANAVSNVYIYDYSGTSWSQNYVINTSINSFGYSLSIAADFGDRVCIGAPDVNTIYVYQFTGSVWSLHYSNTGTDIVNQVPWDNTGTMITVDSSYNRYGTSVQMSAFGNDIVVGAPGTKLLQLNTTNSDILNVTGLSSKDIYYEKDGQQLGVFQLGSVRVLHLDGFFWNTGTVTQKGQILIGDPGIVSGINNWIHSLWSLPGFGYSVQIVPDGSRISVSSPEYTQDNIFGEGRVDLFDYNTGLSNWEMLDESIIGGGQHRRGWSHNLSYDGSRIACSQFDYDNIVIHVLDWSGKEIYETQPRIFYPGSSGGKDLGYSTAMTNGEVTVTSAPLDGAGRVYPYSHFLTSTFSGNNIFGGYIKGSSLYIGSNNNKPDPKQILFGGTIANDNFHTASTIESRTYATSTQSSELLLSKLSTTAQSPIHPDIIRLKAIATCIDGFNLTSPGTEDRYNHNHMFYVNSFNLVGIGSRDITEASTYLDVFGDASINSKFTVGKERSWDWRGFNSTDQSRGFHIFYNTKTNPISYGNVVSSNLAYLTSTNYTNAFPTNITYDSVEKSLLFNNTSNLQVNNNIWGLRYRYLYSLWIKLTPVQPGLTYQLLNIANEITLSIDETNVYLVRSVSTPVSNTYSFNFTNNVWYNVILDINAQNDNQITKSNIYVNNNLLVNDTNTINITPNPLSTLIIGDGFEGHIGSILFSHDSQKDPSKLYEYGPPTETLAVSGDAYISGSVKSHNPKFFAVGFPSIQTTGIFTNTYNSVIVNIGNYYLPSGNKFTVPINGVYYFEITGSHDSTSNSYQGDCELTFYVNGASQNALSSTTVSGGDKIINKATFMKNLELGDIVQAGILTLTNSTEFTTLGGHFSGYLLP